MDQVKTPSLFQAFIPIIVLIALLALNVYFFEDDSSYGPNQIALLVAAGIAGVIAINLKVLWKQIMDKIVDSISSAMSALIILLLIGALAGTWLISGVVPAMIYYGLNILNPTIFLFAACIISSIVSLATGSSWSTIATVGIALLGIGQALGIADGWIAGAIISGAYFGDKMSPLSDTTNLAPAVAGTDLFTHIKHMIWTTGPSIIISLIVFLIVGFLNSGKSDTSQVDLLLTAIEEKFVITPWLFIVPLAVVALIIKRVPAIPALFVGSLMGGVIAIIFQPQIIESVSGITGNYVKSSYVAVINAMSVDTAIESSNESVAKLLSSGGMNGMMNTIWLILCALTFGGAMQAAGLLRRIVRLILSVVNSVGSLIFATAGTCVFFNLTASDQYLAIVVPGKMYADAYEEQGLRAENLSRTLEDSGTVTSVLIPWNTCGAFMAGTLGIGVIVFAPYCIFNWLSPLMTVFYGFMGWKVTEIDKGRSEGRKMD